MANKPTALSSLMADLGRARAEAQAAYDKYKEMKSIEDHLRMELSIVLKEMGLKTARGEEFTVTIAEKPSVVVRHEPSVVEWIQNTPDIESDLYIGLKTANFQTLARAMLKGTGEMIPGTELAVTESISIKSNKKAPANGSKASA